MSLEKVQKDFVVGDLVVTLDEEYSIIYIVECFESDKVYIKGYSYRIYKMVSVNDIRKATEEEIEKEEELNKKYAFKIQNIRARQGRKYILGKVLHIDGDSSYLNKCLELYKKVGVYAFGVMIDEEKFSKEIVEYVKRINPDIIVLTGHDLFNHKNVKDLNNYVNSKYFADAIKEIRKVDKSVVIIAGACQSNFEALIASGADFASSPKRINIHTFDPAVIAIKVATTSFLKVVNLEDVYKYIENGRSAFGGLETLGKMRLLI